ncbi:MAG: beta-ketoacyl-[acyl-carrier-protein] synthase family protein [Kiritimatiellae bacterium]|nr:beta-ketoacyl-[acyl-carrier-protein] synthase family protein [Kiritimatiellia bacterium]
MSKNNRVAITGLGIVAANGIGADAFWQTLLAGKSGIGPITLFDAQDLPCRIAGEVKNFDPLHYMGHELKPRRLARFSQFALAAALMAVRNAGLDLAQLQTLIDVPVVMGVSSNDMELPFKPMTAHTCMACIPNAAASAIAYALNLKSRLMTVSNACASGLDATAMAAAMIRTGQTDIAIAGGADSVITRVVFEAFCKSGKLSQRNDEPERASRPFDRARDGGLVGEGAGIVILENSEQAMARGAFIYGELTGYGTCSDVPGSEEAAGLERSMNLAMANAPRQAEQIDAVFAHGSSDPLLDRVESRAIARVLGSHAYRIPVTSIKGVTGNSMAAGGIFQIAAATLAFRHDLVPPTANYEFPDPECDLDYVPKTPRVARLMTVMINTHGFGRGNSSLILERMEP